MNEKKCLSAGEILRELESAIKASSKGELSEVLVSADFRIHGILAVKTEKMMGGEKIILSAGK